MSVERIRGIVFLTCDVCGIEEFDSGTKSFKAAIEIAKEEGWLVVRENDGYEHVCPDCASDD